MAQNIQKIWSLYRIINKVNGKNYIGQAINISKRWSNHIRSTLLNKPTQIIHHAMIKYGLDNFEFEVIACCRNQDDANFIETELVKQYNTFITNGKGYNATLGGMSSPKSEEFKQMMRDWHASLSKEEKEKRRIRHRDAMVNLIATKGHPAANRIVPQEEREIHRKARLEKPLEYTDELRQKMSNSHIGIKDSEDTKSKKSESAKEAWEKRIDYSRKCEAPGCDIEGKHKYMIIQGIRYCQKHGFRILRYGRLNRIR